MDTTSNTKSNLSQKRSFRIRTLLILDSALAFLFLIVESARIIKKYDVDSLTILAVIPLFMFILVTIMQLLSSKRIALNNSKFIMKHLSKTFKNQLIIMGLSIVFIPLHFYAVSADLCINRCENDSAEAEGVSALIAIITFFVVPFIIKKMLDNAKNELLSVKEANNSSDKKNGGVKNSNDQII